jgi:hypothetical protein
MLWYVIRGLIIWFIVVAFARIHFDQTGESVTADFWLWITAGVVVGQAIGETVFRLMTRDKF